MTTTEQNQNSSANTSPDEPEAPEEKSFEGIPYDHFENDVSGETAPLSEEAQSEFDTEIERLMQFKKG
jgi:hypothetical protein